MVDLVFIFSPPPLLSPFSLLRIDDFFLFFVVVVRDGTSSVSSNSISSPIVPSIASLLLPDLIEAGIDILPDRRSRPTPIPMFMSPPAPPSDKLSVVGVGEEARVRNRVESLPEDDAADEEDNDDELLVLSAPPPPPPVRRRRRDGRSSSSSALAPAVASASLPAIAYLLLRDLIMIWAMALLR